MKNFLIHIKLSILTLIFALISTGLTINENSFIEVKKISNSPCIYQYTDNRHKDDLNQTRKDHGIVPLIQMQKLDDLALQRCLRYVTFFIKDSKYFTDTLYSKKEVHNGFQGLFKSENATMNIQGAGVLQKNFINLDSSIVITTISKSRKSFEGYRAGIYYNKSIGHLANRINKEWKYFGTASIILFYYGINLCVSDTNAVMLKEIPQRLFINYEVFD